MKQTVYVDVLISINLLVDYFLLYATAIISGRSRERARLCIAAVIGGASSLIILLPNLTRIAGAAFAIAVSVLMTAVGFSPGGWRTFLRTALVLYALSAAYSGIMLLLWYYTGTGNLTVNNGAVYINISPIKLVLATVAMYAVITVFSQKLRARNIKRSSCTVTVFGRGKSLSLEGLIDTGNVLTEPFSGTPVIVAAREKLREVLPEELADVCAAKPDACKKLRLRAVPFHSAGGSGVLMAYAPERIDIELAGKKYKNVRAFLAVASEGCAAGERALVNPDIIND